MTTTFPKAPKLLKGALIGVGVFNPVASVIVFQYNPETLSRTLEAQTAGEGGSKAEALRLEGPPRESYSFEVMLDAADQLEKGDSQAGTVGLHPALAALEMLLYPKSSLVIANTALLAAGTIEIIPPAAPLTLLILGPQRVLPVSLSQLQITEEAHDPLLNPVRAKVSLSLRVLNYNDLPLTHPGYHLFLSHQIVKETMAVLNTANAAVSAGVTISELF